MNNAALENLKELLTNCYGSSILHGVGLSLTLNVQYNIAQDLIKNQR
jgi:hypothetical protein